MIDMRFVFRLHLYKTTVGLYIYYCFYMKKGPWMKYLFHFLKDIRLCQSCLQYLTLRQVCLTINFSSSRGHCSTRKEIFSTILRLVLSEHLIILNGQRVYIRGLPKGSSLTSLLHFLVHLGPVWFL